MVLEIQDISGECPNCGGTGIENFTYNENDLPVSGTRQCTMCNGETRISSASLSIDLVNSINDIITKLIDIKEKVDEIKEKLEE